MTSRPPLPPFTQETAVLKVRLAEDGWNTRDPEKVSLAYSVDSDDTLRFAELRGVRAMIETYPLDKAPEAYARMMSGKAEFRVVLTM